MLRGAFVGVLTVAVVCTVALSLFVWAAPTPPKTDAPAPTPPAPSASAVDVPALLQAAGLAFTQTDKTKPYYKVMVESGGSVALVYCDLGSASWKYPDGGDVPTLHLYTQIGPSYTQDNPPTAAFMRTALEDNCKNWFGIYNIDTNQKTGEWSFYLDYYVFVRGLKPEVLSDYFLIIAGTALPAKDKYAALMKSK